MGWNARMRTRSLLVLLSFGAVATAGCGGGSLTLQMGEDNNSGQAGTAALTEDGDVLEVVLELTVGNAAGSQPAHIHTGTCADLGGIRHALTDVVDGASTTRIEPFEGQPLRLDELLKTPHALNVHSAPNHTVYVSCADILR